MKIPKTFMLFGHRIKVEQIEYENEDRHGHYDARSHTITLYPAGGDRTNNEHTFLHECVHAWMQGLGRDDLDKDEAFVDSLAGLIHQFLTSRS